MKYVVLSTHYGFPSRPHHTVVLLSIALRTLSLARTRLAMWMFVFFSTLFDRLVSFSLYIFLLLLLYVYGLLVPVVFFFHAPALQMTHTKNANARAPMYIQKTIECQCMRFCLRWQIV